MAVYPVGTPRYEFREGSLVRVVPTYNSVTGQQQDILQDPSEPENLEGYGGEDDETSRQATIPTDSPEAARTDYNLPGATPVGIDQFAGPYRGLGQLPGTENVPMVSGQQQYDPSAQNPWGTGTYGTPQPGSGLNFAGGNTMAGNSLTPEQKQEYGGVPAGPLGGGAAAATPGGTRQNIDLSRGDLLYDVDNPLSALQNVMKDMGMGRGFGNPFVQWIQKSAPGLALDFMARNAMGGAGTDVSTDPFAFKKFIEQGLGGGTGGMGTSISSMAQTAGQLPGLIDKIRALNSDTSGSMAQVNPFLELMAQTLDANYGQGTQSFLSNLLGPSMPTSLSKAYTTGLGARLQDAQRQHLGAPGTPFKGGDVWQYLLPRGPGG